MKLAIIITAVVVVILLMVLLMRNRTSSMPTEGFIPVTGGKVWYKIVGAEHEGIPLLVLHGGPGAPHDYLESLGALATDRPVIFYDQLGCGNSDQPADTSLWTVDRFVEELELVRKALKLEEIHLLGQSWGTMLAVEYILRKNPKGVKSLVLSAPYLSTQLWSDDQRAWIELLPAEVRDTIYKYEALGDYASSAYQEAMMAFYQKHVCRLDPWPESINRTFEKMGVEVYNHMWGASEFTINGTLLEADLTEELHKIKIPVLFTCGEFDEATPITTALYQSKLPDSELHIFEGASHMHHVEKMHEFNFLISDFIKRAEL